MTTTAQAERQHAALAEVFHLMGDPSRLSILMAVLAGPRPVAEIAAETGLSPSLVSHHLRQQRRALGVVLAINLIMFVVEIGAGWRAQSLALQADALDFLGDSVNYAIALFVLGRSLSWRADTAWADLLVGLALAALAVRAGLSVMRQVRAELATRPVSAT